MYMAVLKVFDEPSTALDVVVAVLVVVVVCALSNHHQFVSARQTAPL